MLETFLPGVATVPRLEREASSMVKILLLRQATNEYPPPPVDMGQLGTLLIDSREKTIAIMGGRQWLQAVKQA